MGYQQPHRPIVSDTANAIPQLVPDSHGTPQGSIVLYDLKNQETCLLVWNPEDRSLSFHSKKNVEQLSSSSPFYSAALMAMEKMHLMASAIQQQLEFENAQIIAKGGPKKPGQQIEQDPAFSALQYLFPAAINHRGEILDTSTGESWGCIGGTINIPWSASVNSLPVLYIIAEFAARTYAPRQNVTGFPSL